MPTGHTTRLPHSTCDRETLRVVAVAYRRVRRLGEQDLLPALRGNRRRGGTRERAWPLNMPTGFHFWNSSGTGDKISIETR
jgi:hypothetical protein